MNLFKEYGMRQITPNTIQAAAIDRFGGIETITLQTLPVPEVGLDHVLVRVESAGVGTWDVFEREGMFAAMYGGEPTFPYVLGSVWNGKDTPGDLAQQDGSFVLQSDKFMNLKSKDSISNSISPERMILRDVMGAAEASVFFSSAALPWSEPDFGSSVSFPGSAFSANLSPGSSSLMPRSPNDGPNCSRRSVDEAA